jgi:competence protein ComEC
MDSPEIAIFDVGHGNCSLIVDDEMTFVVDTPQRNRTLNLALAEKNVSDIDAILISHGDADHIGGVLSVLSNPGVSIDRVYVNPDVKRDSELWTDFRTAMADARKRGQVRFEPSLTTSTEPNLQLPRLDVEVLAPTPETAISGAGGTTVGGRPLSANAMSAVIRIKDGNCRGVLLPGDIDGVGFPLLLEEERDVEADILVFPHHGGRPGNEDPEKFAYEVTAAVKPSTVIFSLSRKRHSLPRPEVIKGVREAGGEPHIACTQLSAQCASSVPGVEQPYLSEIPSVGRARGHCCAGTVEVRFTEDGLHSHQLQGHPAFVNNLPQALCRS